MKNLMALISSETKFAARFGRYLNESSFLLFTALLFSSWEEFLQSENAARVSLIVCEEELFPEVSENDPLPGFLSGTRIVLLSPKKINFPEENRVFRYQKADQIVRDLMFCLRDQKFAEDAHFSSHPAQITGVFSPSSPALCAAFSLIAAGHASKAGKTLLVSFQEFSGFSRLFPKAGSRDLSDFFYYLKQNTATVQLLLSMTVSLGPFDLLPPFQNAGDSSLLGTGDYLNLLSVLVSGETYDSLILQLPSAFSSARDLTEFCGKIYLPYDTDLFSEAAVLEFERFLPTSGALAEEKIRKVPVSPEGRNLLAAAKTPLTAESFYYSAFGEYLKKEAFDE